MSRSRFVRRCLALCFATWLAFEGTHFVANAWQLDEQWTKLIRKGITFYHFRIRLNTGPVHLFMIEVDPRAGYALHPVIANDRIGSLAPVDKLGKSVGAVAAINGGFFDTMKPNLPVGLIKINYETIFEQFLPRPVLGIDASGRLNFETFYLHSFLYIPETQAQIPLNGYNRKRKYGEVVAFGSPYGDNTNTNEWGKEIVLRRISPAEPVPNVPNLLGEKYLVIGESDRATPIPKDGLVISLHSAAVKKFRNKLSQLYPGAEVEIRTSLPAGWEKFPHLLGGGPMIIKNGEIVLDYSKEKFSSRLNYPAARTAVGETFDGKAALIVVDKGDKDYSVGVTWEQLGILGRDLLNLKNLMGFDGGGSSSMFIENKLVNKPSGGIPRAVANILAVVPLQKNQTRKW